jgi:hypothetical protein
MVPRRSQRARLQVNWAANSELFPTLSQLSLVMADIKPDADGFFHAPGTSIYPQIDDFPYVSPQRLVLNRMRPKETPKQRSKQVISTTSKTRM